MAQKKSSMFYDRVESSQVEFLQQSAALWLKFVYPATIKGDQVNLINFDGL